MDKSQKFIGRNRPPRVQIEYEVKVGNAQKKINLPFVMGVMADLTGKPKEGEDVKPVDDRQFQDIDAENFNAKLKAMKPHVAFDVPNMLTGEGNLKVDLTFESMDDFSPAAVARKVEGVREFLDARKQLRYLLNCMDGKLGAEKLIAKLINDPSLLETLTAELKPEAKSTNES
jgi:type VI secretion system protein ImpB